MIAKPERTSRTIPDNNPRQREEETQKRQPQKQLPRSLQDDC